MPIKHVRPDLKTFFETGDRPTEGEFIKLIDSMIIQDEDLVYVDDSKRVGIGTKTPTKQLDVNGSARVQGNIDVTGHIYGDKAGQADQDDVMYVSNGSTLELSGNRKPGREGDMFLIGNKGAGSGKIHFSQNLGNGNWRKNMLIDTTGNVGIGSSSPQDALQVGEGINKLAIGSAVGGNLGYGTSYVGFNAVRDANKNWLVASDGANNGGATVYGTITGRLHFSTFPSDHTNNSKSYSDSEIHSNTRMTIESTGHVGIGILNPTNMLEIDNSANTGPTINTGLRLPTGLNASTDILSTDGQGNVKWIPRTDVTDGFWQKHGTNDIANGNGGNVGINQTTPTEKLHVDGNIRIKEGHDILLRGGNDRNHGLGFYHNSSGNFGNYSINGPVLYGYNAGGLGTRRTTDAIQDKIALFWNRDNRVGVREQAPEEVFHVNGNTLLKDGDLKFNQTDKSPFRISHQHGNDKAAYAEFKASDGSGTNVGGVTLVAVGLTENTLDPTTNQNTPANTNSNGFHFTQHFPNNLTEPKWRSALRIDNRGHFFVQGVTPFVRQRFVFSGKREAFTNLYPPKDYTAIIGGTQFHRLTIDITPLGGNYLATIDKVDDNTWKIICHYPRGTEEAKNAEKKIDVLFIRNELAQMNKDDVHI